MSDNFDNSQATATQTQTTGTEVKWRPGLCRHCKTAKKPNVEWPEPEYCSAKCRGLDGREPLPSTGPQALAVRPATLEDYLLDYPKGLGEKGKHGQKIKGRTPKRYHRRFDPEKLNWGEPLTPEQLSQAGCRENREPILGDWDYVPDEEGGQEDE